jgi:hypothetical protein
LAHFWHASLLAATAFTPPAAPRRMPICLFNPWDFFNQRSNQAQKRLMLGISLASAQKYSEIGIGYVTAGRGVRLVPDEQLSRLGIAGKKPPIPVRTAVKLFPLQGHLFVLDLG